MRGILVLALAASVGLGCALGEWTRVHHGDPRSDNELQADQAMCRSVGESLDVKGSDYGTHYNGCMAERGWILVPAPPEVVDRPNESDE